MQTETQVVIIGAGPVGLSMALALARQGIKSIIVERHVSTSSYPKTRDFNTRTMEIFRLWEIDSILKQYQLPEEQRRLIWLESFQGKEITQINAKPVIDSNSPIARVMVPQNCLEQELLNKIKKYSEICYYFNAEMTDIKQTEMAVSTVIKDKLTGKITSLKSDYLVAADGASSSTRQMFDITMNGEEGLGEFCSILCEMDLSKYIQNRRSANYFFTREDIMGVVLLSVDGKQKWLCVVRYDIVPGLNKESFTDEVCIQVIRKIIDDNEIDIKFSGRSFWTMSALIADKFRDKRILLTGDAAHCLPPTGTLGVNTGIQDAHNLAWKLAAVIKGIANEALLNTYFEERASVVRQNIAWSVKNYDLYTSVFMASLAKDYKAMVSAIKEQYEFIDQVGLDIGFIYNQGAIIHEDDNSPPSLKIIDYQPSTYPGCRAPHYWLKSDDKVFSTLDLFDNQFVLLSSDQTDVWHKAISEYNTIPLVSYCIGKHGDFQDPENKWLDVYQISATGAILVRPDGHVAWRSQASVADPKACLDDVFERLLFKKPV